MAVAASILTAAYHLVRDRCPTGNWVQLTCCALIMNVPQHGSPNASGTSVMKLRSEEPLSSQAAVSW